LIKFDIDLDYSKVIDHEIVGLFIERGREKKRNHNSYRSHLKFKQKKFDMQLLQEQRYIKANYFKLKDKQKAN
jgi:hypothetical protein